MLNHLLSSSAASSPFVFLLLVFCVYIDIYSFSFDVLCWLLIHIWRKTNKRTKIKMRREKKITSWCEIVMFGSINRKVNISKCTCCARFSQTEMRDFCGSLTFSYVAKWIWNAHLKWWWSTNITKTRTNYADLYLQLFYTYKHTCVLVNVYTHIICIYRSRPIYRMLCVICTADISVHT